MTSQWMPIQSMQQKTIFAFVGLSRAKVQNILISNTLHYGKNAKCLNEATLKPIRAQDVRTRHQVDLMNMGKGGTVSK